MSDGPRRFALLRKLGEGSIGIVYEAYDREHQMRVALKTLRHLDRPALARLRQEFRAVRRLSHPNVITLHELVNEGNAWSISMELVEGRDVVAYIRTDGITGEVIPPPRRADSEDGSDDSDDEPGGRDSSGPYPDRMIQNENEPTEPLQTPLKVFAETVDETRLRRTLAQLAQGLHAIHLAGLIHRDLKPSNVLVTELGRAVLMDFSIVAEARNAIDYSSSGAIVIGTPGYMAPEQATGEPPSPAIDWYALGAILYQAITGRVPFEGHWEDVLIDKQEREPEPLSLLVKGVPRDLERLCMELLAMRSSDRPTGDEVLRRLGVESDDPGNAVHGEGVVVFVGRDGEVAELIKNVTHAANGESIGILLRGPSGMGKSALLRRFVAQLGARSSDRHDGKEGKDDSLLPSSEREAGSSRPPARSRRRGHTGPRNKQHSGPTIVLSGTCHPSNSGPYQAMDGIMDELSRVLLELPKERIAAILPDRVSVLLNAFPALGRVPAIQLAPAIRTRALRDQRMDAAQALRSLLANLAAWRTLVLCIDDLQWADRDSLGLLEDLFLSDAPPHIMFLASLRTEEPGRREASGVFVRPHAEDSFLRATLARLTARGRLRSMNLAPLSLDTRRSVLAQLAGGTAIETMAVEPMTTPLILVESARFQAESAGQATGESVPELGEILRLRIERLPGPALALLETAAVAGEPAPLSILAEAANLAEARRERASKILRAVCLVRVERPGREPWLTTYHETVREAVLSRLTTARTREIHQGLALALQRSGVATPDLLAYHWQRSGDQEQALRYLVDAARGARARLAFIRAADLYRAACLASADLEERRQELLRALAETLSLAGLGREAAQVYEQSAAGASDRAILECRAVDNLLAVGDIAASSERVAEVISGLEARRRGKLAFLAPFARLQLRGWRDKLRGESAIPARDLERMDALYAVVVRSSVIDFVSTMWLQAEHLNRALRQGERRRVCRALAVELPYLAARGGRHTDRALTLGREVIAEAEQVSDTRIVAIARLGMGAAQFLSGGFQAAGESAAVADRLLAEHAESARWERYLARYLHCLARLRCGDLVGPSRDIERAMAEARRFDDLVLQTGFATRPNLWRLMRLDRIDEALEVLRETAAMWPRDGNTAMRYGIAVAKSMGYAYRGDAGVARQSLGECVTLARQLSLAQIPWLEAELYGLLGRVALLAGSLDEAKQAARDIARMRWPAVQGHADLLGAALAHRNGNRERAETLLTSALERFTETGEIHFAMSAKFRQGQLIGPESGQPLRDEAMAWCEQQGVVDARRLFDYLCPWS